MRSTTSRRRATPNEPSEPASRGVEARRRKPGKRLSAEDCLAKAMAAKSTRTRNNWALEGLARREGLDRTTHAMLLRQLYLAHYAEGQFARAHEIAQQAIELTVLEDVFHQDAARALQALGDIDAAVGHLRLAARLAPAGRRAFHHWTLGSVLFLAGRSDEAITALERAARWGTSDKPLYQGHLALAKCQAGRAVRDLDGLIARLAACPAGQGYGRFVLGQLAFASRRYDEARSHLESFVARTTRGRRAIEIALSGELAMARRTLEAIEETA